MPNFAQHVRVTMDSKQGGRKYMEDVLSVKFEKSVDGKKTEFAYFAVFDGHGGAEAAEFAKQHLYHEITKHKCFSSDNDDSIIKAIKEGFISTHRLMWKHAANWPKTSSGYPSTSGTTASVVFIKGDKMYVAHVGDSGVVVGEREVDTYVVKGQQITEDHKPENPHELQRIQSHGGAVVAKAGVKRVVWNRIKPGHKGPIRRSTELMQVPFLAVARSLGDLWSYNSEIDEFVVSPEPDVSVYKLNPEIHWCVVLASDGLWNMMRAQEAVEIVDQVEKGGTSKEMSKWLYLKPARALVTTALDRWYLRNMRPDNTSVIVLTFDFPAQDEPPRLVRQNSDSSASTVKASDSDQSEPTSLPDIDIEEENNEMKYYRPGTPEVASITCVKKDRRLHHYRYHRHKQPHLVPPPRCRSAIPKGPPKLARYRTWTHPKGLYTKGITPGGVEYIRYHDSLQQGARREAPAPIVRPSHHKPTNKSFIKGVTPGGVKYISYVNSSGSNKKLSLSRQPRSISDPPAIKRTLSEPGQNLQEFELVSANPVYEPWPLSKESGQRVGPSEGLFDNLSAMKYKYGVVLNQVQKPAVVVDGTFDLPPDQPTGSSSQLKAQDLNRLSEGQSGISSHSLRSRSPRSPSDSSAQSPVDPKKVSAVARRLTNVLTPKSPSKQGMPCQKSPVTDVTTPEWPEDTLTDMSTSAKVQVTPQPSKPTPSVRGTRTSSIPMRSRKTPRPSTHCTGQRLSATATIQTRNMGKRKRSEPENTPVCAKRLRPHISKTPVTVKTRRRSLTLNRSTPARIQRNARSRKSL